MRPATADDMARVTEIFNRSIDTTATWSETYQTVPERQRWFADRRAAGDGVYVAEIDGVVVGFGAYGDFRDTTKWPGYRFVVENTVHVDSAAHGRGVGGALMAALVEHAAVAGKRQMIAAIDGENEGSIEFHRRLGFVEVGRLPQIGWKFDRWLDLVLLQRELGSDD